MPYYRALPWLKQLAAMPTIEIVSTFIDLTEDSEFDKEQVNRLVMFTEEVKKSGLSVGNAGDMGTLVGPDHPAIEPNAVNKAAGVSVYDILMHMNPNMPQYVV